MVCPSRSSILPSSLCPLSHSRSSLRPAHSCVQVLLTLLHSPPRPSPAASHWLVSDPATLTYYPNLRPKPPCLLPACWPCPSSQQGRSPHLGLDDVPGVLQTHVVLRVVEQQAFLQVLLGVLVHLSEAERQDSWDQDAACSDQLELLATSPLGGVPRQGRSTPTSSPYQSTLGTREWQTSHVDLRATPRWQSSLPLLYLSYPGIIISTSGVAVRIKGNHSHKEPSTGWHRGTSQCYFFPFTSAQGLISNPNNDSIFQCGLGKRFKTPRN